MIQCKKEIQIAYKGEKSETRDCNENKPKNISNL